MVPSAWVNMSKMFSHISSGMPMPVSLTRKVTATDGSRCRSSPLSSSREQDRLSHCTDTDTPPSGVNLMALPTRLIRIWRSLVGSPFTLCGTLVPT